MPSMNVFYYVKTIIISYGYYYLDKMIFGSIFPTIDI